MASTAQAKRYAQAVFQIAQQTGELDRWQSDLADLGSLERDNILLVALETPNIDIDRKAALVSRQFPNINRLALNLVCLLAERGGIGVLPGISQEYQKLLDAERGIERAEVVTAVPLDEDEKRQLEERLAAITGKKMVIQTKVDPAVVGGVVARFSGKLLDGSTRSRLQALKKEIGQIPR